MEDTSLRLEFHRALDAVTPSAPWLGPRVREELRRRRHESLVERARRRPFEFAWLLPAVAVLLAIAIIVTVTLSRGFPLPLPIPVGPHTGAAPGCADWGYVPGGGNAPSAIKMTSATVGWAPGDLRTTDGGAHWHDVSPKDLRAGEPYLPGQQTVYPPGYADFFLDSNHAWLTRSYDASASCLDHIAVFRTADGGGTWQTSSISPQPMSGAAPQPVLYFLDAQHGWLLLAETSSVKAGKAPALVSPVYRTVDGGRTWQLISSAGPPCPGLVFSSPNRGFSACGGQFSSSSTLWTTTDGGGTWKAATQGLALPVFFDSSHGAALGYSNNGAYAIYVTADGGVSWEQTASAGSGATFAPGGFEPYAVIVGFEDVRDFWLFTTQPGWAKGGLATDWLYHSSDGGATWQLVQQDTPVSGPSSISFPDPNHGFVVQTDQNGATEVMVTSDGGHTWRPVKVQIS